jgi:amino acid adenylation domain-containing protein
MENMMALLALLRQSGITIRLQGDNLELDIPEEGIPDALLRNISASKEELKAYLFALQHKASAYVGINPAPPAPSYPLSSSQYRVWLTTELEGSTAAYNIPFILELEGALQPGLFIQAIGRVIERHEILRTVFRKDGSGEIRQWILEPGLHQPAYIDLRKIDNREDIQQQLLSACVNRVFDLENGPLFSISLLQPGNDRFVMAVNIHHIICDGWSIQILMKDLIREYQLLKTDSSGKLTQEPLVLHYRDYAVWQQEQLKNGVFARHSAYWTDKLRAPLPVLDLPAVRTRPAIKTYNGNTQAFALSSASSAQIIKWVHQKNGLPLMVFLAAVKTVLYRYTGQQDIIVGTPVSGRNFSELHDQIGFYVNTVPLRTIIDGTATFARLFESIRATVLKAMEHQEYPLDLIINDLDIKRDTSRATLFDVLVGFQNTALENFQEGTGDITIKQAPLSHNQTKFDITVMFRETKNHITFHIDYNTDIYDKEMISRFGQHITTCLENAVADENVPIQQLNYLHPAEQHYLVHELNNINRNAPHHETITSLFEEQVKKYPDRIAVVCEQRRISYYELDVLSWQLAHYLVDHYSVKEKDFVGIMIERNEWLMITILATLKTGAAFVPFDRSLPEERNKIAMEDSGCNVIIDQELVNDFLSVRMGYPATPLPVSCQPGAAAYLIYTSGTTGKPKGVITTHANIINYHYWFVNAFDIQHTDVSILLSSFIFSGVYTSIYCTILSGGTLHIVPRMFMQNTPELTRYIVEQGITFLKITPSHLDMLIHLGDFLQLPADQLRLLVVGGDRVKTADLRLIHEKFPLMRLVYHYGASETTMGSLFHEITAANISEFCREPRLGKPIDNAGVYLLDTNRQLLPAGVVGEICVSGRGLSPGYLNNPAQTDKAFFYPDFIPDVRVYATGDMGKRLEDGTITFIGRNDEQVKVRGHRIELAEIDSKLLDYDSVISAKTLPYNTGNGETELAAYVIAANRLQTRDLRSHLKKYLPEYMVPTRFSQLDAFPTGVTGKIDLKAFPDPSIYPMDDNQVHVAAGDQTQITLLDIWKNILGRPDIGVTDNFFELGGHSLNFAILINRYASELHARLSMRDAFIDATITAHARLIDLGGKNPFESIPQAPVQEDYPLSNAQQRLWMLCQLHSVSTAFNIPVACVLKGNLNYPAFEQSLLAIIERHEVLRTIIRVNQEGEARQIILPVSGSGFHIGFSDLSGDGLRADRLKESIAIERSHIFQLDQAPLLKATLFKVADDEHVFSIIIHHIICDRWSMNILIRELMFLYRNIVKGTAHKLPDLKIQYKDYATWQRRLMMDEMLESSRQYWQRQLSGTLPELNLRSSQQRPAVMSYNGATVRTFIDTELYSTFVNLLHQEQVTLFMGVTTITAILLYHYSGQDHFLIGAPFAGREHTDLEDQVGFYVNMLPLSVRLDPQDTFTILCQKVKAIALEANQHQIYPLDELVDQLRIRRNTSRGVLFDVVVSVLDNQIPKGQQEQGFTDLLVSNYTNVSVTRSRFDLLFNFEAAAGVLHLDINYNTDLFTETFVTELINTFCVMLKTIIRHPAAEVNELTLLNDVSLAQDHGKINNTTFSHFVNDLGEFNF